MSPTKLSEFDSERDRREHLAMMLDLVALAQWQGASEETLRDRLEVVQEFQNGNEVN